ncbi:hypothetical protein GQ43DRAFT_432313 [Delitschia confertaspora ATCC 74209]|uniref:Uncharacterized protein n=1 Tax=Delitschia confertaspora ATCC 74209 TaxID=1513339 RepID=A0A9P4JPE4_9PLEO|nr:hypothetical protein GQ43DRAFT_432313 [Delitschia confertaspora ATCC 74209]
MDAPQNYKNLFELMTDIFFIFVWLNQDQTLDRMRGGFNRLVDKYVKFESAANLRRDQNGIEDRLNLTGKWAKYYHGNMSNMSNQTHQRMVDRVDEVQTCAFHEYIDALKKARNNHEVTGSAGKRYYECIQDLFAMMPKAGRIMGIPMVGFMGCIPSGNASDISLERRHSLQQPPPAKMIQNGGNSKENLKQIFQIWVWIEGYDSIKDKAGLEYINGRDVGIAEEDIETAKRHFKPTYTQLRDLGRMWTEDFLVVDHQYYSSYTNPKLEEQRLTPPFGPSFGDRDSFICLMDTEAANYNSADTDRSSPGHKGELKVLSSLVLEELYPLPLLPVF